MINSPRRHEEHEAFFTLVFSSCLRVFVVLSLKLMPMESHHLARLIKVNLAHFIVLGYLRML